MFKFLIIILLVFSTIISLKAEWEKACEKNNQSGGDGFAFVAIGSRLVVTSPQGYIKSDDNGDNWEPWIYSDDLSFLRFLVFNGKNIYSLDFSPSYISSRSYISSNNGDSWSTYQIDGENISYLINYKSYNYAIANSKVYYSSDYGDSWEFAYNLDLGEENYFPISMNDEYLFGYKRKNESVNYSSDKGKNWTKLILPNNNAKSLGMLGKAIFASSNSDINKSTDMGNSWTTILKYDDNRISQIHVLDNYVIALMKNNEVHLSKDSFNGWFNLGVVNNEFAHIQDFAINEDYIYAFSENCPWRYKLSDLTNVEEVVTDLSNTIVYPNPASDFITITLSNKELQHFATGDKVQIFNVLGIEVGQSPLVDGINRIDVSYLISGVYFIRIGDKVEKFVKM